jgi:hypothetical protein
LFTTKDTKDTKMKTPRTDAAWSEAVARCSMSDEDNGVIGNYEGVAIQMADFARGLELEVERQAAVIRHQKELINAHEDQAIEDGRY